MTAPVLVYLPRDHAAPTGDAAVGSSDRRRHPLALHGWNHTPELFRDRGRLARWADAHGLVIAIRQPAPPPR